MPRFMCFLAIEITSRRLASTISVLALWASRMWSWALPTISYRHLLWRHRQAARKRA